MNDQVAASEQIAEREVGENPNRGLNPHMGDQVPAEEPEGKQEPATAEEKDGESPSPSEETAEKKPDDDVLKRKVGELAFENRQLRRELEAREAAREEPAKAEPLKTLKDFDYDEQSFNEYLIEEGAKRGEARARRFQTESTVKTEAQRQADEFAAREDAFEAEVPGFKERLHAKDLMITGEMAMFITDPASEVGLHVGDYLSRNKAEAARIAGLPTTAQTREMVKLEEKIGKEVAKAKAAKQSASKAPTPPSGLDGEDPGGRKDPSKPADADKMSDEEWLAARNKQLEAKRKR